jgi:hypothetical protein
MADALKVLNRGPDVFEARYNRQTYRIQPGESAFIPHEAVCLWLGDPASRNVGKQQDRRLEAQRLSRRYGAYDDKAKFEANKPNLEVHDLDGNRVVTVVDDPSGDSLTPPSRVELSMMDMIERLEKQVDQLKRQAGQADVDPDAEPGEAATDTPDLAALAGQMPDPDDDDRDDGREPATVGAGVREDKPKSPARTGRAKPKTRARR